MVNEAVAVVRARVGDFAPRLAVITGSGLAEVVSGIDAVATIPATDLPGFPRPTVGGHSGDLVLGVLAGTRVVALRGRVHGYEGRGFGELAVAIRTMRTLGADTAFLTCAAGSLRPQWGPGTLMAVADHINLMGTNPLMGANDESFGPRFPDMVGAWTPAERNALKASAAAVGAPLEEGVYAACIGPAFETPAEIRMLSRLGADAVGMSMVPDCLLARHAGMRVVGVATITNHAAGLMGDAPLSHEQTLSEGAAAAERLRGLLARYCADMAGAAE